MNTETKQPIFNIRIVRANLGGTFTTTADFGVGDMLETVLRAEELQAAIDLDGDPCRVYVVGHDGIALHAGGAPHSKWTRYYHGWRTRGPRRGPYRGKLIKN